MRNHYKKIIGSVPCSILILVPLLFASISNSHAQETINVVDIAKSTLISTDGTISLAINGTYPSLAVHIEPYSKSGISAAETDVSDTTYNQIASRLNIILPKTGLYKISITATGDHKNIPQSLLAFRALPLSEPVNDLGVMTHFAQRRPSQDKAISLIKTAGFSLVRDELYWSNLQHTMDKIELPEGDADYISNFIKNGLHVLLLLDYGNNLYKTSAKGNFPNTPESINGFLNYTKAVVTKYKDSIYAWEIWNEPQNTISASPNDYYKLASAVSDQIVKILPNARVLACGGGWAGGGAGGDCLYGLAQNGIVGKFSGITTHPYMSPHTPDDGYTAKGAQISQVNIPNESLFYSALARKNESRSHTPLEVWVSEIGWPSNTQVPNADIFQAGTFAHTFLLMKMHKYAKYWIWYDFSNDGTDPTNREHNFGLVDNTYAPKPAYAAANVAAATIGNMPIQKSEMISPLVSKATFSDGTRKVIALFSTNYGSQSPVQISLNPGLYTIRSWDGRDTSATIGGSPLKLYVSYLPVYLIQKNGTH